VPLGERTVNGRYDRDRIEVGRYEGRYSRLTMVVENSDLELIDFKIVFGDRTEYHPRLNHYFREGQRTQVIELPPGESVIRFIDFQYRNLAGGGDASVRVFGFRTNGGPPPPPPPAADNHPAYLHALSSLRLARAFLQRPSNIVIRWDENRAIREIDAAIREIREAAIDDGKNIDDHPPVDRPTWGGRLQRALEMVVQARDEVSRDEDSPSGRVHRLRARSLEHIGNAERAIRDGIEAARSLREEPPPPPAAFSWDQRGWTMLGEKRVDSRREDSDRIEVSRWEPRFRRLTLVVLDADMELIDLTIKFKHAEPFHPDVRQFFRENSRARVIDLPGDERTIRWIEFRYRNLPGQGRARVQVWAK
jgi:hypothetical protein